LENVWVFLLQSRIS